MTLHTRSSALTVRLRLAAAVAAAAAIFTLSACSGEAAPGGASANMAADTVTVEDAWVKAVDSGMSGAFATLSNTGDTEVTLVSADTDSAESAELHETVESDSGEMLMRAVDGGFSIPAGETFGLEPGGAHVMLMGLNGPLKAGEQVTIALTFSDGSTLEVIASVKDYSGANEQYDDMEHSEEMDH